MIEDTIGKIEARIQGADAIKDDKRRELERNANNRSRCIASGPAKNLAIAGPTYPLIPR